jgi:hypothetical protein
MRPRDLPREDWAAVLHELRGRGMTYRVIAAHIGCHETTLIRCIERRSDLGHNLGQRLLLLRRLEVTS